MSLLRLSGINTYYGEIHILEDVNLEVEKGELVSLLGGNASGKSTTLKTILGLVRPRTGTVEFGGEQQMVAMGRALMSHPTFLLMDEPSMGLAPILVERSFEIIQQVHQSGVAMLVVEQNANMALSIADRGYVLSTGRLALEGPAKELLAHEDLRKAYLGR